MYTGSVFRKWDLHVHSPASYEHQYRFNAGEKQKGQDDIWEKYISKLEEIKEICAICVTDYFCIDGYKKVLEYRKKGKLANFDLILPNVEFRLDKFVGKENQSINFHVIFSDEVPIETIEKEFLEDIKFEGSGGEKKRLDRLNIAAFGKKIKAQQNVKDGDDWVVGCKNVVVSMDEITSALKKKDFEGKHLLVLAEPEWALIDWKGRDHNTRKNLLIKSHCIFSSNAKTRDWALGFKDISQKEFVEEFGTLKPCIHGSDCHSFDKLCKPDMNRFCWIKGDVSFEGLKQILFEPLERVKIQYENPEERKNIYSLASIKINECKVNDELTIPGSEIGINENLSTIIGGKGSGKTAILDLVANCFEQRCYKNGKGAPEEKNSFIQRIEIDDPNLNIGIKFIGHTEEFTKRFTEDKFFDLTKITYLPQGQIEEYSSNRKKLNTKIQQVIFDNEQVKEGNFKEKFEKIETEVEELNKHIEEINTKIFSLEKETTTTIEKGLNEELAQRNGELTNKKKELDDLRKKTKAETLGKAQELRDKEKELQRKIQKIESFTVECTALEQELYDSRDNFNEQIGRINKSLTELKIDDKIPIVDYEKQTVAIKKALLDVNRIEKGVSEDIKGVEKDLEKLVGIEKAEAGVLKEIGEIQKNIDEVKNKIEEVKKKKNKISAFEKERLNTFVKLLAEFLEWRKFYKQVIEAFSKESSKILDGVKFESSVHFDAAEFFLVGEDILNMVSVQEQEIKDYIKSLANALQQETIEKVKEDVNTYVTSVMNHKNHLKKRKNSLDFYNWVFSNYYSLNTNVFFNDVHMDRLSIGQKGTVLLKIFLAEGDYPLIVDMPEENLDNKFIYDELKDTIRQAKKKRQIILATNNANLVVNTDAEEVIVAEYKDNSIRYKVGSIEDKTIRDEITHILEGGREALIKREQKYGFL